MSHQEFINIEKIELLNTAQRMKNENYRLAQICVTKLEQFAFLYTFEKDYRYITYCFSADYDAPIPSIDYMYPYAFLYENEMKDLFGVIITDLTVDFNGHLYKTAIKTPYNPKPEEKAAEEEAVEVKEEQNGQ